MKEQRNRDSCGERRRQQEREKERTTNYVASQWYLGFLGFAGLLGFVLHPFLFAYFACFGYFVFWGVRQRRERLRRAPRFAHRSVSAASAQPTLEGEGFDAQGTLWNEIGKA